MCVVGWSDFVQTKTRIHCMAAVAPQWCATVRSCSTTVRSCIATSAVVRPELQQQTITCVSVGFAASQLCVSSSSWHCINDTMIKATFSGVAAVGNEILLISAAAMH